MPTDRSYCFLSSFRSACCLANQQVEHRHFIQDLYPQSSDPDRLALAPHHRVVFISHGSVKRVFLRRLADLPLGLRRRHVAIRTRGVVTSSSRLKCVTSQQRTSAENAFWHEQLDLHHQLRKTETVPAVMACSDTGTILAVRWPACP
jgi:hypothetical protein